ncbi:MAG: O-antigen ligase family protein [Arachnia sp.]
MSAPATGLDARRVRAGNAVAWLFVPFVAVAQFATFGTPLVRMSYPIVGISWLTYELIALVLLAGAAAPWLWWRRRELGRPLILVMASFTALVAYGIVSALVRPEPGVRFDNRDWIVDPIFLVVPLATAWLAMIAGVGLVLAAERPRRLRVLVVGAAAALPLAFLAWPMHAVAIGSIRFATGQGGAAVVHVLLLLAAAFALAWYLAGGSRRRRVLSLCLVGAAVVGIVATQSRGALITLLIWGVLLAVGRIKGSGQAARLAWPLVIAAAALAFIAPVIPGASRVLSLADPLRLGNIEVSLRLWSADAATVVFGTGPGGVWPWHFFESMTAHPREYETVAGNVLGTPHSTPLAALVELGLVGAALLACVLAGVALIALGARGTVTRWAVAAAVLATLVAFLFDTYLLRNFGIALWWWAAVALVATWPAEEEKP